MTPLVSVIIPSYNHAPFIQKAVNSVLSQTLQDLEVIVIDDGSSDLSPAIIRNLNNPRVRSIILEKNLGACEALNIGIRESRATLIAICNSDDEWLQDKLALQLSALHSNSELAAVFSDVSWIDERSDELDNSQVATPNVFKQGNRPRAQWLRDLAQARNCLCHPSVLIRREVYSACGVYDNFYRQLPDYEMWLRVLEKFQIRVMPDKLVRFRICAGQENTSAPTPSNLIRDRNEHALILRRFFKQVRAETFAESFGTTKSLDDPLFSLSLEKSLYLAKHAGIHTTMFRDIAIEILYEYLQTQPSQSPIVDSYGLSQNAFHTITGLSSPWHNRYLLGPLTAEETSFLNGNSELEEQSAANQLDFSTDINTIQFAKSSRHQIEMWHALESELAQVLNSTSWKMTRPLRAIKSYLSTRRPQPKS